MSTVTSPTDPLILTFYEHLLQEPEDWETRAQLADYYEDQGLLVLARGQRWQIKNKKRPSRISMTRNVWTEGGEWFTENSTVDTTYRVPTKVYQQITGFKSMEENQDRSYKKYDTFRAAEEDLAQVLEESWIQ